METANQVIDLGERIFGKIGLRILTVAVVLSMVNAISQKTISVKYVDDKN